MREEPHHNSVQGNQARYARDPLESRVTLLRTAHRAAGPHAETNGHKGQEYLLPFRGAPTSRKNETMTAPPSRSRVTPANKLRQHRSRVANRYPPHSHATRT